MIAVTATGFAGSSQHDAEHTAQRIQRPNPPAHQAVSANGETSTGTGKRFKMGRIWDKTAQKIQSVQ